MISACSDNSGSLKAEANPTNQQKSDSINETISGYPWGNASISKKIVCARDDCVYIAKNDKNNSKLIKMCPDESIKEIIFDQKAGFISNVNVIDDWIFFSLEKMLQKKNNGDMRDVRCYSICKIKNDGSGFQQLIERRIFDMWACNEMLYYSLYSKKGADGIYCIDTNGETEKLLFEKTNIWFVPTGEKMYSLSQGDIMRDDKNCELYQMNFDGGNLQKISSFSKKGMDYICLLEDSLFYLDSMNGELYKTNIGGSEPVLLASDVTAFCIEGEWIYFTSNVKGTQNKLSKIQKDGKNLSVMNDVISSSGVELCGVFNNWIYFDAVPMLRISIEGKTETL